MKKQPKIVTDLAPDLADKIWKSIEKKRYDDKVSKDAVLHHLKQLKAQMGKHKANPDLYCIYRDGVDACMEMIDKKIAKIKSTNK